MALQGHFTTSYELSRMVSVPYVASHPVRNDWTLITLTKPGKFVACFAILVIVIWDDMRIKGKLLTDIWTIIPHRAKMTHL